MTSESDPIRENNPTPNAESESGIRTDYPKQSVPPTTPPSQLPPSHAHYKITCQPEKDWWEKHKRWAELAGMILLAVYTLYTIKMYCANKVAAEAAKDAANTSANILTFSQDSFKDEQRAWVGAITVRDVVLKKNEPSSFKVVVINSGKTPALHLKFLVAGTGVVKGNKIDFVYHPAPNLPISDFVLQPGAQYFLGSGPALTKVTKNAVYFLTHEIETFYIYGQMTYEDTAKRPHHTKFCFFILPDLTTAQVCDTYNEAD